MLSLSPSFDASEKDYSATTTNASNKITATADNDAIILVSVNGNAIDNGSSASWNVGSNLVTISVAEPGKAPAEYNVIVTKS